MQNKKYQITVQFDKVKGSFKISSKSALIPLLHCFLKNKNELIKEVDQKTNFIFNNWGVQGDKFKQDSFIQDIKEISNYEFYKTYNVKKSQNLNYISNTILSI